MVVVVVIIMFIIIIIVVVVAIVIIVIIIVIALCIISILSETVAIENPAFVATLLLLHPSLLDAVLVKGFQCRVNKAN